MLNQYKVNALAFQVDDLESERNQKECEDYQSHSNPFLLELFNSSKRKTI